jgi:hypothetical protein
MTENSRSQSTGMSLIVTVNCEMLSCRLNLVYNRWYYSHYYTVTSRRAEVEGG